MELCRKTILLLILSSIMSVGWGQDCIDGVEVELWGECYNIEETTQLYIYGTWENPGDLIGEIPTEIGDLTNLSEIRLQHNQLTGEIPLSICNLINLDRLYLYDNQLTGEIPECVMNLTNLTGLLLNMNELSGHIPENIGQLINLRDLRLNNNQLIGEIPNGSWNLTNLEWLYLYNNQLTGQISEDIGNLTDLNNLILSDNLLTGEIPESIGELINLTDLRLSDNQLIGEIPQSICNLVNLNILNIQNDIITGVIPECIENLSNLRDLRLNNNQLIGEIPESICDIYYNLDYLYINENQLCPPYPDCLTEDDIGYQDTSECEEPSLCDEGYTEIDGECYYQSDLDVLQQFIDNSQGGENPPPSDLLPIELGCQGWEEGRLRVLVVDSFLECGISYQLSGNIPLEIGNLIDIGILILSNNQLNFLPESIGDLINLEMLLLNDNQLSGVIPDNICQLDIEWGPLGTHFNISNNNLCPPYPWCLEDQDCTPPGTFFIGYQDTSECEDPNLGLMFPDSLEVYPNTNFELPIVLINEDNLIIEGLMTQIIYDNEIIHIDSVSSTELLNNYQIGSLSEPSSFIFTIYGIDTVLYSGSNEQILTLHGSVVGDIGGSTIIEFSSLLINEDVGSYGNECYLEIISLCDEGYTEIDGECYYQSDLDVLQQFIDNSIETINMDMDVDGSGVIEPIELGVQEWFDGRIESLNCEYTNGTNNECNLSGEIPSEIGDLSQLIFLNLYRNNLSGIIPISIGNLIYLSELDLNSNEQLTGPIPTEIGNLTSLTNLDLGYNQLTGEIPVEICNQGDSTPIVSNNKLCSPYPDCGEGPITSEEEQDTSECINIGDVNGDLEINVSDIIILVDLIMNDEYNEYGDIDGNGYLNVMDVVQLVNFILDN